MRSFTYSNTLKLFNPPCLLFKGVLCLGQARLPAKQHGETRRTERKMTHKKLLPSALHFLELPPSVDLDVRYCARISQVSSKLELRNYCTDIFITAAVLAGEEAHPGVEAKMK